MLDKIRQKSNSKYVLLVFGVIILVFIFWGVGPSDKGRGTKTSVAVVNGDPVSAHDYEGLYRRQVDYYRQVMGSAFSDDMAKKLDLKHAALNILIDKALAVGEAKSQGIRADDKEVQEVIAGMKAFQKENVFDKDVYFQVLKANRYKPADFEKAVAGDLVASKMEKRLFAELSVSDEEIRTFYLRENRRINLKYVSIEPSRFAQTVKVTDDEAREYLKKKASLFVVPVSVKAFYVYASFGELEKRVKSTPAEVSDYYEKNKQRFIKPAIVKASHILIRPDLEAKDKEAAKKAARDKAMEVLSRVRNGERFVDVAKKYSQDPGSAKAGGDLGWFPRGEMVKPFEETAFSLKKGEMSGLVESDFGFHIILVTDKKDETTMPVKEAEPFIKRMLSKQKSWSVARDAVISLQKPFFDATDVEGLKKAASNEKGISHGVTGYFSHGDKTVELAKDPKVMEAVLTLKTGQVSPPVETDGGVYMIKLLDRREAHAPEYKDAAKRVKDALTVEKAEALAKNKADEIIKKIKDGAEFEAMAKAEGLSVSETGFFRKTDRVIAKIKAPAPDRLFDVKKDAPNYPEAITYANRFYVFKFKDSEEADASAIVSKKEELRATLLDGKKGDRLKSWLKDLRAKAKIEVFEENM